MGFYILLLATSSSCYTTSIRVYSNIAVVVVVVVYLHIGPSRKGTERASVSIVLYNHRMPRALRVASHVSASPRTTLRYASLLCYVFQKRRERRLVVVAGRWDQLLTACRWLIHFYCSWVFLANFLRFEVFFPKNAEKNDETTKNNHLKIAEIR